MGYITKRQEADYARLRRIESTGHVLTSDGLRFICAANEYDPKRIGEYFLELLGRWNADSAKNF